MAIQPSLSYLIVLLLVLTIHSVAAVRIEYTLAITTAELSPDCHPYRPPIPSTLLINGQFPGPAIRARRGDTLVVRVQNQMFSAENETVTMHYHGIRQRGTPLADGVPFLTQYPIPVGEEYVYEFDVKIQAGTYFYHSHIGMQSVSAFGALIIEDASKYAAESNQAPSLPVSQYRYDEERIFLLSDWWHQDRHTQEAGIVSANWSWIGEPDSLLINGRTINNASFAGARCEGYDVTVVEHGKIYRFRIVGAQSLETLAFGIANHTFTIIEIDGQDIKPVVTDYLEIAPGQRYSVLFHANQTIDNYYIHTDVRWRTVHPKNGIAILHYSGANNTPKDIVPDPSQLPSFPREFAQWITAEFKPLDRASFAPYELDIKTPAREIVLTVEHINLPSGRSVWTTNNVVYQQPKIPLILDILSGTRSTTPNYTAAAQDNGYDEMRQTYPIRRGEHIDIVLQNTVLLPGFCEAHPWHTHGHFHWDIAYGSGQYDPLVKPGDRNPNVTFITDPVARDTSLVYPTSHAYFDTDNTANPADPSQVIPCGWKKIRIFADNPGVWLVHCHILAHMMMGMQIVLEEAVEDIVATVKGERF